MDFVPSLLSVVLLEQERIVLPQFKIQVDLREGKPQVLFLVEDEHDL